jgi:predicted  nucleic acid-binding Zn-ribbon protein
LEDQIRHLAGLSAIDEQIVRIRKNMAEIPARVAENRAAIDKEAAALQEKSGRREDLKKERKRLEADLADVERKIEQEKERELKVRTNEELHALQREVKIARAKQDEIEEKILVLMEDISEFEKEIVRAEKRFAEMKGRADGEIAALEAVLTGSDGRLAELEAERAALTANLTADLLRRYARLLGRNVLPAVARAEEGICVGCHSRLQPQLYNQILAAAEIYACPICARLLIHVEREDGAA